MSAQAARTLVFVAAIVAAGVNLLGAAGLARIPNLGYSHAQWTVQTVAEDGPTAAAGLKVGDRIVSLEGIDVTDRSALGTLARLEVGDLRTYGVERGGETFDIEVVAQRLPASQIWAGRANSLVGLVFLACGLFVISRSSDRSAVIWAALGIAAAIAFTNPPFRSFPASAAPIISALFAAVALTATALFCHLMFLFPVHRQWIDRPRNRWLLYLPVVVIVALALATPFAPAARRIVVASVFWLELPYLLLGVALFIRGYRGFEPERRRDKGLVRLVGALVISLVPFIAIGTANALGLFSTPLVNQLSAILLVLVPLALTSAILRDAREPAV